MPVGLGQQGPHPEVLAIVSEARSRDVSQDTRALREQDLSLLQQRSLFGLRRQVFISDDKHTVDREVDVTVGLAMRVLQGGQADYDRELININHDREVIAFELLRMQGENNWGMAMMSGASVEKSPKKPWSSSILVDPMFGLTFGAVVHSPDVARVRVTLSDGLELEEEVSHGSLLLFAPFYSSDAWATDAMITIYDSHDREIVTDAIDVSP